MPGVGPVVWWRRSRQAEYHGLRGYLQLLQADSEDVDDR
jgi:hypothetical protein